jgi:hypothetical protein
MPAWLGWTAIKSLPWKYIGIALAILSAVLLVWRAPWAEHRQKAKDQAVIAALNGTISNMRAASDKAAADNKAKVAATQAADEQTRKEQTDALSTKLVDARAAVAAYLQRLRDAQAHPGSAGTGPIPQTAGTPSPANGAGESAVVPVADLQICAENTVKSQGWQDWYRAVSANWGVK